MTIEEREDTSLIVDRGRIESAVRDIIEAIHEDPDREGLQGTPSRVARMYAEVFAGLREDPLELLRTGFDEDHHEMVIARDVPFYSMCEHHFLPFFGMAHIGYIPQGRVAGISKLARLIDVFARRPQLQERLTSQIADALVQGIKPMGAGVVIEAEHLCIMMRGVRKPGSRIVTSANRGVFLKNATTRAEFLNLVQGGK
jgi:GTP cyclohydrolase I